jgi:serine phosphatase RsbU (regulator of sigma subunit)
MDDYDERTPTFFSPKQPQEDTPATDPLGDYLVAIGGTDPGRIAEVQDNGVTIGRDPGREVVFADTELSRLHARVTRAPNGLVAEDLGSTNGTFVDGVRISAPTLLRDGAVLRVGRQYLKYERRTRKDAERAQELARDIRKAFRYVTSLLPPPITDGPLRVHWRFHPSAHLGGDAFGYDWLAPDTFLFYLMDVAGHGVGAAMHSVTVMNVMRQRALPQVDFADPAAILTSLNNRFQMDQYDDMYFTMWCGVYDTTRRTLTFSVAGHHAAYVVPAARDRAEPLTLPDMMIGAMPELVYQNRQCEIAPGSTLYLFSDGAFELVTKDEHQWGLSDFLEFLKKPVTRGVSEPDRLYKAVQEIAGSGPFADDFTLLSVTIA